MREFCALASFVVLKTAVQAFVPTVPLRSRGSMAPLGATKAAEAEASSAAADKSKPFWERYVVGASNETQMRVGPFGAEFVKEEAREMKKLRRGLDAPTAKGNAPSNTTIDYGFVTRELARKRIMETITYHPPGGVKQEVEGSSQAAMDKFMETELVDPEFKTGIEEITAKSTKAIEHVYEKLKEVRAAELKGDAAAAAAVREELARDRAVRGQKLADRQRALLASLEEASKDIKDDGALAFLQTIMADLRKKLGIKQAEQVEEQTVMK